MTDSPNGATATNEPDSATDHAPSTCPVAWCPVCLAVSAMQPISPDVIAHLLKAGTEMFLAFRAVIESRGDDLDGSPATEPVRLEKIDIG
ncbi:MAG TPA: hypothetical protein VJM84_00510 [Actinomycetota bacterium]|nr:hypothetical protein [Actinomycetota bacterium]